MDKIYRKELKYRISILDFYNLRSRLECFALPDPYSGYEGYRVRSLYFDSMEDRDLRDTLDGNMEKRKIRLRFYPPNTEFIRLEYKCKSGTDGLKHSIRLTRAEAECIIAGDYSLLGTMKDPFTFELYGLLMTGGYRPRTVVEYNRMAYVYPAGSTRLNFDTSISASCVTDSFFDREPGLVPIMAPDVGIFEVKYDNFLAGVLKEILRPLDSMASGNSKYAESRFIF